jgi:hypothetical protein
LFVERIVWQQVEFGQGGTRSWLAEWLGAQRLVEEISELDEKLVGRALPNGDLFLTNEGRKWLIEGLADRIREAHVGSFRLDTLIDRGGRRFRGHLGLGRQIRTTDEATNQALVKFAKNAASDLTEKESQAALVAAEAAIVCGNRSSSPCDDEKEKEAQCDLKALNPGIVDLPPSKCAKGVDVGVDAEIYSCEPVMMALLTKPLRLLLARVSRCSWLVGWSARQGRTRR